MTTCRECVRLHLLLKLTDGEMRHTLCMDAHRMAQLVERTEVLEDELAYHRLFEHSVQYTYQGDVCLN